MNQLLQSPRGSGKTTTLINILKSKKRNDIINGCKKMINKSFQRHKLFLETKLQFENDYTFYMFSIDMKYLIEQTQAQLDKLKTDGEYK